MKKAKIKKIATIFVVLLALGYVFSFFTKNNSEKYFNYEAQITALPFIQIYSGLPVAPTDRQTQSINDCPGSATIAKGFILPLIHAKLQLSTKTEEYQGPCL